MTGPRQRGLGQLVSLTPASAAPKAPGRVSQECGRGRTFKDCDFRTPACTPGLTRVPTQLTPSVKRQVIVADIDRLQIGRLS